MNAFALYTLAAALAILPAGSLRAQADSTPRPSRAPTTTAAAVPTSTGSSSAGSVVPGARIIDVAEEGTFVTLDDGTTWEVYLPDRTSTVGWRAGDLVIVSLNPVVVGQRYDYRLANGRTDSQAAVKFRGQMPRD